MISFVGFGNIPEFIIIRSKPRNLLYRELARAYCILSYRDFALRQDVIHIIYFAAYFAYVSRKINGYPVKSRKSFAVKNRYIGKGNSDFGNGLFYGYLRFADNLILVIFSGYFDEYAVFACVFERRSGCRKITRCAGAVQNYVAFKAVYAGKVRFTVGIYVLGIVNADVGYRKRSYRNVDVFSAFDFLISFKPVFFRRKNDPDFELIISDVGTIYSDARQKMIPVVFNGDNLIFFPVLIPDVNVIAVVVLFVFSLEHAETSVFFLGIDVSYKPLVFIRYSLYFERRGA